MGGGIDDVGPDDDVWEGGTASPAGPTTVAGGHTEIVIKTSK